MTRISASAALLAAIFLTGACAGSDDNDRTVVVRKHTHSLTIRTSDGREHNIPADRAVVKACAVGDEFPACAQEAGP